MGIGDMINQAKDALSGGTSDASGGADLVDQGIDMAADAAKDAAPDQLDPMIDKAADAAKDAF
jgi:hypothetical protein